MGFGCFYTVLGGLCGGEGDGDAYGVLRWA